MVKFTLTVAFWKTNKPPRIHYVLLRHWVKWKQLVKWKPPFITLCSGIGHCTSKKLRNFALYVTEIPEATGTPSESWTQNRNYSYYTHYLFIRHISFTCCFILIDFTSTIIGETITLRGVILQAKREESMMLSTITLAWRQGRFLISQCPSLQ